jgi:hypothetical protein
MQEHAQRIKRIQDLCSRLESTIRDSQQLHKAAQDIESEAGALVKALRKPDRTPRKAR